MNSKSKLSLLTSLFMCLGLAFPCFSAWAEGEPYFECCIVQSVNTADGMRTQLVARVFDSNGTVPQTINTFNVTGPGGFAYSFTDDDYDVSSNLYAHLIQAQGVDGEYTFTVTDNEGKTAVSYSYLKVGDTIPLPDPLSFQASGDPLSPTLSWGAVAGYEGNLFYWAEVYDMEDNVVWRSGITSSTSVDVPGGILVGGESYKWGVDAFDNYHYFASSNRAFSQIVPLAIDNSRPYFAWAAVYNLHDSAGFFTALEVRVVDPNGTVPGSITSLTVTGPGGFFYAFQPADYLPVWNEYYRSFGGRPADGVYAFTATDNEGKTSVTHDYVRVHDVPLVDVISLQASGDPLAPVLSWGAPPGMDQSLYFRAIIHDIGGNRVWDTGRFSGTSATVPPGVLQAGVSYRWQVRAPDDNYWSHFGNRSNSNWVDLAIDNARPYFVYATVYNRHDPDGFYTTMDVRVADPNGTVPDSITSLYVTGPGGFFYAFQPEDYGPIWDSYWHRIAGRPVDGVYTFIVTDNEGRTAVSHDYVEVRDDIPSMDESTFLVSGNPLAPTISWGAISGYQGPLYYRLYIDDTEGNFIYMTGREPLTSQVIPEGMIEDGKSYLFRIEAYDHRDWIIYNNRSNSDFFPIAISAVCDAVCDFDGDCKTDIAIYRAASGVWWINPSGPGTPYAIGFGGHSSDIAVAEDYEGDGQTDIAIYRAASGVWWIRPSSTGTPYPVGFGGHSSDIPVPGDYDGDGQADIAIYRSASGVWWVRPSSTGTPYPVGFGGHSSDIPVPGDYDGDGQADIAIYRAASGVWWVRPSSTGTPYPVGFGGHSSDIPVPGDYDGDGEADIAIYRSASGVWWVRPSSTGAPYAVGFGGHASDIPVSGDYDGDGEADIAIYRSASGVWWIRPSSTGTPYAVGFGGHPSDMPVNPACIHLY